MLAVMAHRMLMGKIEVFPDSTSNKNKAVVVESIKGLGNCFQSGLIQVRAAHKIAKV